MDEPKPENPFAAALAEGAPKTYLAMLRAGLGESFDPLPKDARGLGLAANLLCSALDSKDFEEIWSRWLALGLDPLEEQARPRGHNFAWPALDRALGTGGWQEVQSAPLALAALASGNPHLAPVWRSMPKEKLAELGARALPAALETNFQLAIDELLAAGASPDARGGDGSPCATFARSLPALEALIGAGADLRAANSKGVAAHEELMAMGGDTAWTKGARALMVKWIEDHPDEDPGAELARMAFAALREGQRDAARKCVLALGERAPERRDPSGQSLAVAAARAANFPEVGRLMRAGAALDEPCADGRSLRGELERWRSWSDRERARNHGAYAQQRDESAKAKAILEKADAPGRRGKPPVDWTRVEAGFSLLDTMEGACTMERFAELARQAVDRGLDPWRISADGLDLPCRIAAHVATRSGWARDSDGKPSERALELLRQWPPSKSAPAAKAELARRCWAAWGSHRIGEESCLGLARGEPPAECMGALEEGFLAWGRESGDAAALGSVASRAAGRVDSVLPGRLAALFEQGALLGGLGAPAAASAPGAARGLRL